MSATAVAHHDHHDEGPIDYPDDAQYGVATAGKIGMWVFLLSDAFSFGGLLLAYGILRGGSKVWGPNAELGEPALGINFTALLTFILICSSVTMVFAHAACVEGDRAKTVRYLGLTALGGAMFLCGQYQEYFGIWSAGLTHEGLHFGASAYATTFFLITSFHGLHVLTGVTYISIMTIRTALGKYDNGNANHIEILGLFWHFVDLVWILVFTFIYLL